MGDEGARVRTLIVDDDNSMRFVSRLILERSGRFRVVGEGKDGLEGIDLASEHQPDLVLLDITMPGMDGFEALPHIRAVAPDTRVVVLTGLSGEHLAEKASTLGAAGFMEKHADSERFLEELVDILQETDVQVPAEGDPAS